MGDIAQILTNQVITASGSGVGQWQNGDSISVDLAVSAVSGTTPSLTVSVQWSDDNVTFAPASTPDAFAAITAAGSVVQRFTAKGQYYRLAWTVTGTTPSFTVSASVYS